MYAETAKNLKEEFEAGGFEAVGRKVLDEAKINPLYTLEQEDLVVFEKSRQRLNTEAGIIISNHPGYYDAFLIMNALKRKDVKIVVSKSNYATFAPIVGEECLIKATHDPKEALSFGEIKDHIDSGGLVLLFPTGGDDRVDKSAEEAELVFEGGLSVILKRCLKPTDMVYSFYVEPEDIRPLVDEKIPRIAGVVSAINVNPALNVNQLKTSVDVKVNERYSKADEWISVMDGQDREEKSRNLALHFRETVI